MAEWHTVLIVLTVVAVLTIVVAVVVLAVHSHRGMSALALRQRCLPASTGR